MSSQAKYVIYDEIGLALCTFSVLFVSSPVPYNAFHCNFDFVARNEKKFGKTIDQLLSYEKHQIKERDKVAGRLAGQIKKYLVDCN